LTREPKDRLPTTQTLLYAEREREEIRAMRRERERRLVYVQGDSVVEYCCSTHVSRSSG